MNWNDQEEIALLETCGKARIEVKKGFRGSNFAARGSPAARTVH